MGFLAPQKHHTTTNTAPWGPQQQYLEKGFGQAQNWLNSGGANYYPGQQVAPFSQAQKQGQAATQNFALNGAANQANSAATTDQFLTHGAMDPMSNPAFQHAESAAVTPIYQHLNRQVLPQQDSQAIEQGAYGGARNGIMQSNAINDANQEAGNVTSQMANHAYDSGLQAATKGLALAPQTQHMGQVPGQLLSSVGQQQQQQAQQGINAAMNKYAYNQQQPLTTAQQYMNLVQGNYGGQTRKPYYTNPMSSALGLGMGAAGLGSSLASGGMTSLMGPLIGGVF